MNSIDMKAIQYGACQSVNAYYRSELNEMIAAELDQLDRYYTGVDASYMGSKIQQEIHDCYDTAKQKRLAESIDETTPDTDKDKLHFRISSSENLPSGHSERMILYKANLVVIRKQVCEVLEKYCVVDRNRYGHKTPSGSYDMASSSSSSTLRHPRILVTLANCGKGGYSFDRDLEINVKSYIKEVITANKAITESVFGRTEKSLFGCSSTVDTVIKINSVWDTEIIDSFKSLARELQSSIEISRISGYVEVVISSKVLPEDSSIKLSVCIHFNTPVPREFDGIHILEEASRIPREVFDEVMKPLLSISSTTSSSPPATVDCPHSSFDPSTALCIQCGEHKHRALVGAYERSLKFYINTFLSPMKQIQIHFVPVAPSGPHTGSLKCRHDIGVTADTSLDYDTHIKPQLQEIAICLEEYITKRRVTGLVEIGITIEADPADKPELIMVRAAIRHAYKDVEIARLIAKIDAGLCDNDEGMRLVKCDVDRVPRHVILFDETTPDTDKDKLHFRISSSENLPSGHYKHHGNALFYHRDERTSVHVENENLQVRQIVNATQMCMLNDCGKSDTIAYTITYTPNYYMKIEGVDIVCITIAYYSLAEYKNNHIKHALPSTVPDSDSDDDEDDDMSGLEHTGLEGFKKKWAPLQSMPSKASFDVTESIKKAAIVFMSVISAYGMNSEDFKWVENNLDACVLTAINGASRSIAEREAFDSKKTRD